MSVMSRKQNAKAATDTRSNYPLRLPPELHDELVRISDTTKISRNTLIQLAIRSWLAQDELAQRRNAKKAKDAA